MERDMIGNECACSVLQKAVREILRLKKLCTYTERRRTEKWQKEEKNS